jgi:hypothetical protein
MNSVQVEMRCKRNPNPNPISKGVGYLTLAAATGSIIHHWEEDLVVAGSAVVVDDTLQEGPEPPCIRRCLPDLTSSEFGKGTRRFPTANPRVDRLRASQRDWSTTARSPSGEHRPSVSRRATTPPLRPVASPAAVARSGEERRGETKMTLGFRGSGRRRGFVLTRTTLSRRSQMNGSHAVGLNEAQTGGEKVGPSLRCFNFCAGGWVTGPRFSSWSDRNQFWAKIS